MSNNKITVDGVAYIREDAVVQPPANAGDRAVIITTSKRGVFYGATSWHIGQDGPVAVTGCRMVFYWDQTGGVLGIAEVGPSSVCRVGRGPSGVTELPAEDITSLTVCSASAIEAMDGHPIHEGT